MNDGTCIDSGNGDYLCVCKDGFEGRRCESYNPYDPSDDNLYIPPVSSTTLKPAIPVKECHNEGLCKIYALEGGCKKCICKPGFTGDLCETTVDDCLTMPCANGGKCFDMHNDVHCECEKGFTGIFCEDDIDECKVVGNTHTCHNGGTCVNTFGSYDCICPPGYTGVKCDEVADMEAEQEAYVPLITRMIVAADTESTTFETTTSLPIEKSVPPVIKEPGQHEIKITSVIHRVTYNSGNARVSINAGSQLDANTNSTMQILTFIFMGVAILILGAILGLVWVRCFRSQSKVQSEKDTELAAETRMKIPTVAKKVKMSRKPIYRPQSTSIVETASDSIEELDDESTQPCISRMEMKREDVPDCPSPPPPYALSAVDVRRQPIVRQPFFVALPPKARQSTSQLTEKRRILMTAYDITSRDDMAENSSLLEADSPTLSHKIVV